VIWKIICNNSSLFCQQCNFLSNGDENVIEGTETSIHSNIEATARCSMKQTIKGKLNKKSNTIVQLHKNSQTMHLILPT